MEVTGDTPIFQLTVNQLLEIMNKRQEPIPVTKVDTTQKEYVYGIAGLAKLLNCSLPTAQRIKNSGEVPYTKYGRKIVFEVSSVLNSKYGAQRSRKK